MDAEGIKRRLRARIATELPVGERTRFAAVAMVLRFDREEPNVLLIRRAERANDHWSGHMAFPGGRQEPNDASPLHAAMREAREEVGVDLDADGQLLGRIDDVQAISKGLPRDLIIVPYVFGLTREVAMEAAPLEVAEVLWAPIGPMLRGEIDTTIEYVHDGKALVLPGYLVGEHIVWGLTYRMLELFFGVIRR